MIEVKDLTKRYGSFEALRGVSFSIEKGHVYGLLGPNGAGKSTTMNIMAGCLAATSGSVTVNGHDIYEEASAAKRSVGYLPEIPPLYPEMTPVEYLKFIARAKKFRGDVSAEVERVCDLCGVTDVGGRLIKHLSKGYRQRVGVAGALIGDPEIVILDEPTVGLDPAQIIEIRQLISSLRDGHAVVLSSHIMGEITAVCDYIIIMACGEIVAAGTLDELEGTASGRTLTLETSGVLEEIKAELSEIEGVSHISCYQRGDKIKSVIECAEGFDLRETVFKSVCDLDEIIYEMTSSNVSLEDLFIKLTEEAAARRAAEEAEAVASAVSEKEEREKKYDPLASPYIEDTENEDNVNGDNKEENDPDKYVTLFSDDSDNANDNTDNAHDNESVGTGVPDGPKYNTEGGDEK